MSRHLKYSLNFLLLLTVGRPPYAQSPSENVGDPTDQGLKFNATTGPNRVIDSLRLYEFYPASKGYSVKSNLSDKTYIVSNEVLDIFQSLLIQYTVEPLQDGRFKVTNINSGAVRNYDKTSVHKFDKDLVKGKAPF